ncbi:hypothetical protein [Ectobacillus sp. sgz5001026]|uniref:hypothetical protein n=1 Tax=Ectobacillus sp. sgz5001026 TaxID=3242473 RepID=UPI0036D3BA67
MTGNVLHAKWLFDHVYRLDVRTREGALVQMVGTASQMKCNKATYLLPIYIVAEKEGKFHVYMDAASYSEQKLLHFTEQIISEQIQLDVNAYSVFDIPANAAKVVLLMEEASPLEYVVCIESLRFTHIETEVYVTAKQQKYVKDIVAPPITFLSAPTYEAVYEIFEHQTMGTKLCLSGTWPFVDLAVKAAHNAGFTDEEIQYRGFGPKEEKVFCIKCYHLNKKQDEQVCDNCQTRLSVSQLFSKRHGAYLGYINIREGSLQNGRSDYSRN